MIAASWGTMSKTKKAASDTDKSDGSVALKSGTTGRGSPEAIAKRRAARALNTLFENVTNETARDYRTERRRRRLLKELREGKTKQGRELKALDILQHAHDLLEMGETLGTLKKAGIRPIRRAPQSVLDNPEVLRDVQANYQFDPRAWRFLGLELPT